MDQGMIVAIIAAVVAIGAVFYARSAKVDNNSAVMSTMQALGAGILGLGLMLVAMPWASGAIAALEFISSSDFAILSGAVYAIGALALIGGAVMLFIKGEGA
jgi:hypothetical protein